MTTWDKKVQGCQLSSWGGRIRTDLPNVYPAVFAGLTDWSEIEDLPGLKAPSSRQNKDPKKFKEEARKILGHELPDVYLPYEELFEEEENALPEYAP